MQLPAIHVLRYNVYLPADDVKTIQKLLGKNTPQEAGLRAVEQQHDSLVDQIGQENKNDADIGNLSDLTKDLWSDAEDLGRVEGELISKIVTSIKTALSSEFLKQNVIPVDGHVVLPEIYEGDASIYPDEESWGNYDHCKVIALRKMHAGETSLSLANEDAPAMRSDKTVAVSFYQVQAFINGQTMPLMEEGQTYITFPKDAERELLIPLDITKRMGNRDQMINPAKQAQYQQSAIMGYADNTPTPKPDTSRSPEKPQ